MLVSFRFEKIIPKIPIKVENPLGIVRMMILQMTIGEIHVHPGMIQMKLKDHMAVQVAMMMLILLLLSNAVLVVVDLPMVGRLIHLLMILQALNIHLKN